MTEFQRIQEQWSRWLRDPKGSEQPVAELRRLQVYERLVRNNLDGFVTRGFPVLFSILTAEQSRTLLQAFISQHQAKTPLFSAIGAEFVEFLADYDEDWLPAWSYQLAVYERMEVEAYNHESACILPPLKTAIEATLWQVNPSLQWHAFDYPVHTIQPELVPEKPLEQACYLAVYRVDEFNNEMISANVKFLQLNAVTMLLVDFLLQHPKLTVAQIAEHLAKQLPQFPTEQLYQGLLATVPELYQRGMLFPSRN